MNARAWAKHETSKTAGALWFASDRCRVQIKLLRGNHHNLKKSVEKRWDYFMELLVDAQNRLGEGQDGINPIDEPKLDRVGDAAMAEQYKLEFTEDFIRETKIKKHLIDAVLDAFVSYWSVLSWIFGMVIQAVAETLQTQAIHAHKLLQNCEIQTHPPPLEFCPTIQPNAPAL